LNSKKFLTRDYEVAGMYLNIADKLEQLDDMNRLRKELET